MPEIEVIVFDLGGVLVELTGVPSMLKWLNYSLNEAELWERWLLSSAVRQFETGKTTNEEFALAMIEEFNLPVNAAEFLREFTSWPRGVYPRVLPVLTTLRKSFKLACFSNNNELHWTRISQEMGLAPCFDYTFLSHLTGHIKPDKEAFEFIIASLDCAPERILFLDDQPLNIENALAVGIKAYCTKGFPEVLATLEKIGLLEEIFKA